jgi:hypothetical protein
LTDYTKKKKKGIQIETNSQSNHTQSQIQKKKKDYIISLNNLAMVNDKKETYQ